MSERPVVLAVTSDTQAGSTTALIPPEGATDDDGGRYNPSLFSHWLFQSWEDYWRQVGEVRRAVGADLYCLFNGDLLEGRHHSSLQLVGSGHKEVQEYIASRVFGVPFDLTPERIFVVRGTPAHVGPLAEMEESLARSWGDRGLPVVRHDVSPDMHRWSWWRVRLEIHGILIDAKHHPGTSGRLPWTRQAAYDRLAFLIWSEHALNNLRHPDLAFRAHIHTPGDSHDSYPTRAIVTGSWQGATEYVHRLGVENFPSFGGCYVVIEPDGKHQVHKVLFKPVPEPVWTASS